MSEVKLTKRQGELLAELGVGAKMLPLGARSRPFHALRYAGLVEFYSSGGGYTARLTMARLTDAGRAELQRRSSKEST